METISMSPIGLIHTPFPEKFGVPRQPGLVPAARGRLIFAPQYRREEALRGLEEFSHLWIVFLFDRVKADEVRLSVRPPRLGGNEKLGVFATRSPFRPNRIGLSVCKLEGIDREDGDGPVLTLSGVDLVDGTVVLDVKPYLPYADCIESASAGFASARPEPLEVTIGPEAGERFEALLPADRELIRETLSWDARPAYHVDDEERTYHLRVAGCEVSWKMQNGACRVVGVGRP